VCCASGGWLEITFVTISCEAYAPVVVCLGVGSCHELDSALLYAGGGDESDDHGGGPRPGGSRARRTDRVAATPDPHRALPR
jgi:hypothetical protein